jgi:hypothetical protein
LTAYLLALGAVLATGSFTSFLAVVFGFLGLGLTFAGMICVLPTIAHNEHEAAIHESAAHAKPVTEKATAPAFGVLKSA